MFVSKKEYNKLVNENKKLETLLDRQYRDYEIMKSELTEETRRLANLLSAEVTDCQLGPWCRNCKYICTDKSSSFIYTRNHRYIEDIAGDVTYCGKHLAEICPEFESKSISCTE